MANAATTLSVSFDVNTCIGFGQPEHPFPVTELNAEWLCPACSSALSVAAAAQVAPKSQPTCAAGGHVAGSRPQACLACYGD